MRLEKIIATSLVVPLDNPDDKNCRWGLNLMLWGEPGIGKSDRVEGAAAAVGLATRTVLAATCQPEDVSGTAFPNTSKGVAMAEAGLSELEVLFNEPVPKGKLEPTGIAGVFYAIFNWLMVFIRWAVPRVISRALRAAAKYGPGLSKLEVTLPGIKELMVDGHGVLFLDELSCARPAVQAAFLGVVLSRRIAGMHLPPGVRVIAAANPPESAAGGWELEPPMANRFCHYNVGISIEEWGEWLMNDSGLKFDPIDGVEDLIRKEWGKHWSFTKAKVWTFLKTNPGLIHKIPEEGHKDRGRAWPSPRTWVFAMRALNTCKILDVDDETAQKLVEGCVGEGAAAPFLEWSLKANLPTPEEALKNGWKPDIKRLDRCMAVYRSVCSYVATRPTKEERLALGAAAWKILGDAADKNLLDLILEPSYALIRAGIDTSTGITEIVEAARPVILKLGQKKMGNHALPSVFSSKKFP